MKTKDEIRKQYKQLRADLDNLDQLSLEIANKCLELDIWNRQYFHLFLPIERQLEIDTSYLLHILQGRDKSVVLPRSNFADNSLEHILLEDHTVIRPNEYGIPEPQSGLNISVDLIEVVFVPLLAYDKKGNRLGYGKGFYDRFLSQCSDSTTFIGLSYFEAEEALPSNENDIPLNYCVTPNKIYRF